MSDLDYPSDLRYTTDHEWVREGDDDDVVRIGMPRPALFDAVEKIRTSPAATDAQFAAAHAALDKMILQLKPLRDLPGIPANDAMIAKGRLFDAKGLWRESTRLYEDVLAKAAG